MSLITWLLYNAEDLAIILVATLLFIGFWRWVFKDGQDIAKETITNSIN